MLNKSILLNLGIAKDDMVTLLGLSVSFMVLALFGVAIEFLPAILLLFIGLICYIVFYVRVVNKVFFRSFFEEEGTMYMTLPISAENMVWGKALAVSGYFTVVQLVLLTGMIAGLFIIGWKLGFTIEDLQASVFNELLSLGGTPVEMALTFGLMPLSIFAVSFFSASFILAIFLKFGMKKIKLLPCWLIYFLIFGIVSTILDQVIIGLLVESIFDFAVSAAAAVLIHLAAGWFLVRYCIKQLKRGNFL